MVCGARVARRLAGRVGEPSEGTQRALYKRADVCEAPKLAVFARSGTRDLLAARAVLVRRRYIDAIRLVLIGDLSTFACLASCSPSGRGRIAHVVGTNRNARVARRLVGCARELPDGAIDTVQGPDGCAEMLSCGATARRGVAAALEAFPTVSRTDEVGGSIVVGRARARRDRGGARRAHRVSAARGARPTEIGRSPVACSARARRDRGGARRAHRVSAARNARRRRRWIVPIRYSANARRAGS